MGWSSNTGSRESLGSRLGFLLLAAGCAVGLGNVWRFPFVVGQNGGAAFVLVYLVFLFLLGFPLLAAELALGRAARQGISGAMRNLAAARHRRFWSVAGKVVFAGNVLLMMYYTDVAGWLVRSSADSLRGGVQDISFAALSGDRGPSMAYLAAVVAVSAAICMAGVRSGVERVAKWMMIAMLALLVVLAAKSAMLPGAAKGLRFYLAPDWTKFLAHPWRTVFDAMGQAFFTLSVGVGCMTIFGSYTGRERSLAAESVIIIAIDTFVALLAGLVVFPACASFGVDVTSGPGLIFDAMPKVFANMAGGRIWGFAFFLFLSLAALTTIVAVFECIIGGLMDETGVSRVKIALATGIGVAVLSAPSVLFDAVLGWEDFVFGQLWLPVGALLVCVFATRDVGWGMERFEREVSAGAGMGFPPLFTAMMKAFVPFLIVAVLVAGILQRVCD